MLGDCANSMLVRRPHWRGSVNKLLTIRASKVAELVGAAVPYEHFKKVSGVPATKEAIKRLNARLTAHGAPPCLVQSLLFQVAAQDIGTPARRHGLCEAVPYLSQVYAAFALLMQLHSVPWRQTVLPGTDD